MSFWKVVKEVSTQPIRQEAERPFLLGIAGSPGFVSAVEAELLGPDVTPEERLLADDRLVRVPAPAGVEGVAALSRCDVVLAGDEAPVPARIRPAAVIPVGDPARAPELLLERREDWQLALARHLPGLRPIVADRIIQNVSRVNAQVSFVSAIPQVVPILAPILGTAPADIYLLTKNQVMMVIRLAAAHGRAPEPRARMREIMPVVGSAFGWRTLARQVAGMVPGGPGMCLKASIAYSATYVTGRVAVFYYQVGRRPTRIEMRGIRQEATRRARTAVREAIESLRRPQ